MTPLLATAFIYLFAASVAVPLSKRFGLGAVLGYLLAGLIIGPGLGLVGQEIHEIQKVAEFGVVMMMFLVGLELEPARLWQLRQKLLGLGGLQIIASVTLITAAAMLLGQPWQIGVVAGCVLSLSSTAIVLQTLGEKNLLNSPGGQTSFSVLLFQDIAAIPMLAILSLLAVPELMNSMSVGSGEEAANLLTDMNGYLKAVVISAVIGGIIVGGHYLSQPVFRYIARSNLPEVFTVFALTLVVGIAALMSSIGLSPALGTFLAGVVLANSEYRHTLESNIQPFKGLLLGLFFITVGAGIDFRIFMNDPLLIIGLTIGFMALKWAVLVLLGKLFGLSGLNNHLFSLGLCQAGEFGFVLLAFSVQHAVIPAQIADDLLLIVTFSMLLTPLLFIFYDKVLSTRLIGKETRENDVIEEQNPVIIAGHGRFGQQVNGLLSACGYMTTVIDYDPDTVEGMSAYGIKTYFGDASDPQLLESAGIRQAKLLVVAIDNPEQAIRIVEHVHRLRPELPIVARAFDRRDTYPLYHAGANEVVRETFDAAIRSGRLALELLGMNIDSALEVSTLYFHRDRHSVYKTTSVYDPDLPTMQNIALVALSQAMDTETAEMIQRLMRGEKIEWTPDDQKFDPDRRSDGDGL